MLGLGDLMGYCAGKEGASLEFPFGRKPACFKYAGRIFAEIYPDDGDFKVTLRCDPEDGERFREAYPGIVVPGYHVPARQRRYKNTVLLDRGLDDVIVFRMIDHSYATLRRGE